MNTATIFDIERASYVDGPGIRTTVFFKGCNLRCAWCHNPESQAHAPQMMFYQNKCTGCGKCKEKCPYGLDECRLCGKCTFYCPHDAREICGKEYTLDEVLGEILKDRAFYESSGGGVTFSGGECMLQIDFLEEILKECKENGIHTAVDTAGHVPYERFERIIPYTDLFLYDVKCYDSEKHKEYTGVGNELILENLAKLLRFAKSVWVRIPIISDVNDTEEEISAISRFLKENGKPEKVELLPYHAMGEHKYGALGKKGIRFAVPSKEKIDSLQKNL
jgi:pyruvate formate lyase activating enzyme